MSLIPLAAMMAVMPGMLPMSAMLLPLAMAAEWPSEPAPKTKVSAGSAPSTVQAQAAARTQFITPSRAAQRSTRVYHFNNRVGDVARECRSQRRSFVTSKPKAVQVYQHNKTITRDGETFHSVEEVTKDNRTKDVHPSQDAAKADATPSHQGISSHCTAYRASPARANGPKRHAPQSVHPHQQTQAARMNPAVCEHCRNWTTQPKKQTAEDRAHSAKEEPEDTPLEVVKFLLGVFALMPVCFLLGGTSVVILNLIQGDYDSNAIKRAKLLVSFGQWGKEEAKKERQEAEQERAERREEDRKRKEYLAGAWR